MERISDDDLKLAPAGFMVDRKSDGELMIRHKRKSAGLNGFLMVWVGIWTTACVYLSMEGVTSDGEPIDWWVAPVFWGADGLAVGWLVYLVFCRKIYVFGLEELSVTTSLLGFRMTKVIQRAHVHQLSQMRDGGTGEDSFPTWGLRIETTIGKMSLIYRQPYESSLWLGGIIADWAGVKFRTVPEK